MILSTLCYIKKGNKTLFLHRIKKEDDIHDGKWVGLGGKIEAGETPEECVKREVLEESGLIIETPIMKCFITFPGFDNGEDFYVFLFEASKFSGELLKESPEGKLKWIRNEKITDLNLWEGDRIFFEWMNRGKHFSGKLAYDNEKLITKDVIFYDN